MDINAPGRMTVTALAFLAIIAGSGTMLSAQSYSSAGKTTYRSVSTRVAQQPATPRVEPPPPSREGPVMPGPTRMPETDYRSTTAAPQSEMPQGHHSSSAHSPFVFDESVLDAPWGTPAWDSAMEPSTRMSASPSPSYMDEWCMQDDGSCQDGGPAPIYSTSTWFRRGRYYATAEFAYMTRETPRETAFMLENNFGYTTSDLVEHQFTPGGRFTIGSILGRDTSGRDHMVEFLYLGMFNWYDERTVFSRAADGSGNIQTLLGTGLGIDDFIRPFTNADSQTVQYGADFDNFELNYRISTRPGRDQMAMQPDGNWVRYGQAGLLLTCLGGMRGASFNENFVYTSTQLNVDSSVDNIGNYVVYTHNDMFGVHLGCDLQDRYDEFSWGLKTKIGGLMNFVDRRSTLSALDPFVISSQKLTDEYFTFLWEAGLYLTYQIRPNLHLRGTYDFIYMSGLALAPENMSFLNGFPTLNVDGHVLIHGGFVGLEQTW